jgi:hypothetical protein
VALTDNTAGYQSFADPDDFEVKLPPAGGNGSSAGAWSHTARIGRKLRKAGSRRWKKGIAALPNQSVSARQHFDFGVDAGHDLERALVGLLAVVVARDGAILALGQDHARERAD